MEREKIIFLRNFFFRAFIIGVAFALFFLIVTYAFWNTWASWVTSWTKVDEKDLGRLTAQRPTFNAQRSTFNAQRSTFFGVPNEVVGRDQRVW